MNVKELLSGHMCRLRYVTRFSNCRRNHVESTAEHTYYVVLYAWFLYKWWLQQEKPGWTQEDLTEVLTKAIFHDSEECLTGDFPRDFKHSDLSLKLTLDRTAKKAMRRAIEPLSLDESVEDAVLWAWQHSKKEVSGAIVELADFMSVASYMYQELLAGNAAFLEHKESMQDYFAKFNSDRFKDFQPILTQLKEIVDELTVS